jgi:hypothetical protein
MNTELFLIRNSYGHLSLAPWQMLYVCRTIVLKVFGWLQFYTSGRVPEAGAVIKSLPDALKPRRLTDSLIGGCTPGASTEVRGG